jgi:hypothetical protein
LSQDALLGAIGRTAKVGDLPGELNKVDGASNWVFQKLGGATAVDAVSRTGDWGAFIRKSTGNDVGHMVVVGGYDAKTKMMLIHEVGDGTACSFDDFLKYWENGGFGAVFRSSP